MSVINTKPQANKTYIQVFTLKLQWLINYATSVSETVSLLCNGVGCNQSCSAAAAADDDDDDDDDDYDDDDNKKVKKPNTCIAPCMVYKPL